MKNILCILAVTMFVLIIGFDTTAYGQRRTTRIEQYDLDQERKEKIEASNRTPAEQRRVEQQRQERTAQIPQELKERREQQRQQQTQEQSNSGNQNSSVRQTTPIREYDLQIERNEAAENRNRTPAERRIYEQQNQARTAQIPQELQQRREQQRQQQKYESYQFNQSPTSSEEWNRRSNPIINGREYSVRERYGNYGVLGYFSPPNNQGHSYDLYESLGRRNLTAKQVFDILFNDLNAPFPIRAVGENGQQIVKGNRFDLSIGGYYANTVEVVDVTETSFTLKAVGNQHTFKGTVTHQVIKDSSGELWLRHTGKGVYGESQSLQILNYEAADYMWNRMAYISNQILNSFPQR